MATQLDTNVKDDLKTQFVTREGTYRLLTLPEYSRPNRVGYTNNQSSPQVRVSIVTLPTSSTINASNGNSHNNNAAQRLIGNGTANGAGDGYDVNATNTLNGPQSAFVVPSSMDARLGAGMSMHTIINSSGNGIETNGLTTNQIYGGDRICFNFGRELYVYAFRGMKKGAELSKPIDKKFYKGTNPSCHDFNATTATATGAPLLVGFTTGQIQLVSPQLGPRELRKLYNEERLIDKTKVTCLKWLPNSPNLFLAAHASGHLYLYNEDLPCTTAAPNYQPFKVGDGYSILTCKSKTSRNPLYKWVFTTENCCINEFSFSPCGSHLAVVSQDGFLRVFHYDSMELLGIARSYFGGFLCVCWSPDGKYIVVGGEDDLVTVWSFHERRVVARGQGHRSWVSVVAFDPYTTSYTSWDGGDFSDDENQMNDFGRFAAGDPAGPVAGNSFDVCGPFIGNEKNSASVETRRRHSTSFRSDGSSLTNDKFGISYRLGSVSQDTQICLWDITEDVLRHPLPLRQRVNSSNFNDTSFMNGSIDKDGIKLIRPVAMSSTTNSFPAPQHGNSPTSTITANAINNTKDVAPATEHNSNSSSSKFSTANCTASSQSSNANTPPDETNNVQASTPNSAKTHKSLTGNTIKFPNCISATKSDSIDGTLANNHVKNHYSSSTSSTSGYYSKTSNNGSSKNSDNSTSNSSSSAFNTLTQKFSNFNFLNSSDKKSNSLHLGKSNDVGTQTRHNRKGLNLLKSYNQQQQQSGNCGSSNNRQSFTSSTQMENNASSTHTFGSLKLGKSSGQYSALKMASTAATTITTTTSLSATALTTPPGVVVTTYDPLKLIGTPACPRFDECPILEPLVCKKIAHERLSALIFREDCFLTACQDGFIYTWARPGYATNITQHLSPSQMAPPGGTIT